MFLMSAMVISSSVFRHVVWKTWVQDKRTVLLTDLVCSWPLECEVTELQLFMTLFSSSFLTWFGCWSPSWPGFSKTLWPFPLLLLFLFTVREFWEEDDLLFGFSWGLLVVFINGSLLWLPSGKWSSVRQMGQSVSPLSTACWVKDFNKCNILLEWEYSSSCLSNFSHFSDQVIAMDDYYTILKGGKTLSIYNYGFNWHASVKAGEP